jgi:DNA polymerase-3 subunit epsilon
MIAIDIESSGLDPKKHSVLSLGAVDVSNPSNTFYDECRAWEGAELSEEALAINGFSTEEAKDPAKKSEAELIAAFIAWAAPIADRTLAAQNVTFDRLFVEAACARAGLEFPFAHRTIDLHTFTWAHMVMHGREVPLVHGHSTLSSSAILAYCGLPEEKKPHNALTGALWHAEAIARMAYTKNIIPDFSSYPLPWPTSSNQTTPLQP